MTSIAADGLMICSLFVLQQLYYWYNDHNNAKNDNIRLYFMKKIKILEYLNLLKSGNMAHETEK